MARLPSFFVTFILLFESTTKANNRFKNIHSFFADTAYCMGFIAKTFIDTHKDTGENNIFIDETEVPAHIIGKAINQHHYKKNKIPFLIGASTSEHQSSSLCTPEICSWSRYAQEQGIEQPADHAIRMNLAKHYEHYFKQARLMGLNSIRFSIEWALVEPYENVYDTKTLDRYAAMTIAALENGITPIICFHHYTDPCWFLDKGGFEKQNNIHHFVSFCAKVYSTITTSLDKHPISNSLADRHPIMWATYNNPSGYAFRSYFTNDGPPGSDKKRGLAWVSRVLKNMMEAHVQVYGKLNHVYQESIVDQKRITKPYIGFLKNMIIMDPASQTLTQKALTPVSRISIAVADMVANESIFNFFTKGIFTIKIPTQVSIKHKNLFAPQSLDYIGINTYSNVHMMGSQRLVDTHPLTSTDNKTYRICPEALYRSISIVSRKLAQLLGIPMYITENGVATDDDAKRTRFYQGYMMALHKALADGFDVRGYLTWTLADNYEWPTKDVSARHYGLCTINPEDQSQLCVKPGSEWFLTLAQSISSKTAC